MTLRVLTVGAGYFARLHLDSWLRMPGARLVGLCDPAPGRARAVLDDLAPVRADIATGPDLPALIAATAPDLVDIVAPPAAHAGLIDAALTAGVRSLICQKPFCGDLSTARAAVARIRAAGALCVVHENFRFQPWYRAIARHLAAGDLGQPLRLTFRLRPGDGQGPRAYLDRQPYFQTMPRFLIHETGVHWIDTFRFLFGDPAWVWADLQRLNPAIAGEDAGTVIFGWDDGRRALFDGNRLLDHAATDPRLTMGEALVEGTEAALMLDGHGRLWQRARGAAEPAPLPAPWARDSFGGDCVHALQTHLVAHLTAGAPVENTAGDYLRVIEIEDAIYRSAAEGRRIRLVPMTDTGTGTDDA